jgi:RNA polymerase sigma factor (sigma-70 family)
LESTAVLFYDELVAKCKQGDTQSFERLYQQYARALYNTSLRIVKNTSDAEDVLQESFTAAFQHLDKFNYSSTFGAWLKRIVVNRSVSVLRGRKLTFVDIGVNLSDEILDVEAIDEEDIQLRVEEIRKAIMLLPDGYRLVLSLFLLEGYDYEEIAEILLIAGPTVRTQYHRGRKKLLQILKQGDLL